VLQRMIDSLTTAAVGLELDPRVQERVARERFGMIKKGEFLYRLVPRSKGVNEVEKHEQ
jgi:cell division protein FtsB